MISGNTEFRWFLSASWIGLNHLTNQPACRTELASIYGLSPFFILISYPPLRVLLVLSSLNFLISGPVTLTLTPCSYFFCCLAPYPSALDNWIIEVFYSANYESPTNRDRDRDRDKHPPLPYKETTLQPAGYGGGGGGLAGGNGKKEGERAMKRRIIRTYTRTGNIYLHLVLVLAPRSSLLGAWFSY